MSVLITKNVKTVLVTLIFALTVIVIIFMLGRRRSKIISCPDGPRNTIDVADFETRYSGYSVQLEASIRDAGKVQGKFSPVQLQQISESLQSANEFRKFLVAGYDSCAITSAQYSQYAARYQALDGLARQINFLAGKSGIGREEMAKLAKMTEKYIDLSRDLALPPP
jgi:hypothetical protein